MSWSWTVSNLHGHSSSGKFFIVRKIDKKISYHQIISSPKEYEIKS